jgi:hypothetical protein
LWQTKQRVKASVLYAQLQRNPDAWQAFVMMTVFALFLSNGGLTQPLMGMEHFRSDRSFSLINWSNTVGWALATALLPFLERSKKQPKEGGFLAFVNRNKFTLSAVASSSFASLYGMALDLWVCLVAMVLLAIPSRYVSTEAETRVKQGAPMEIRGRLNADLQRVRALLVSLGLTLSALLSMVDFRLAQPGVSLVALAFSITLLVRWSRKHSAGPQNLSE